MPGSAPCVAVLGLGEAGSLVAADLLAAGVRVRGYDPAVDPAEHGVEACQGEADAARGAAVVLSVNSATEAGVALANGLPGVGPDAIWADLNTADRATKERLADAAAKADLAFVDVALMSPVPGRGLGTPMLVSGVAAQRYAELMSPLGAQVTTLPGPAGVAATRKLVRSVFFKGMAAAVIEALAAARSAGCEDWLRGNIADEFERAGPATVDRIEDGTYRHAVRRAEEMKAASELLEDLRVPARIARAAWESLEEIVRSSDR